MALSQFANGQQTIRFEDLRRKHDALVRAIQDRLADLGYLDGPADGMFGPVSRWALNYFARQRDLELDEQITPGVAAALLSADRRQLFAAHAGDPLADRILAALYASGHYVVEVPGCFNIVYVEGMGPDGTANGNAPNEFNDARFLIVRLPDGRSSIGGAWEATTEPGRFYTNHPYENVSGAARIAFGQFKAWSMGRHRIGYPTEHEALVQTGPVRIHRDINRDFRREGDPVFTGGFALNQHWGYDYPRNDIRNASAGCLVGRTREGHREFIAALRKDPRFLAGSNYRFTTSILPASQAELESHPAYR